MSLATAEHARIDSRLATLLLVSVFSFASGILISLVVTHQRNEIQSTHEPCPARCSRLILMSTKPTVDVGDDCEPIMLPSAYATPDLIALR